MGQTFYRRPLHLSNHQPLPLRPIDTPHLPRDISKIKQARTPQPRVTLKLLTRNNPADNHPSLCPRNVIMASRVRQKMRARSATLCTRGEYNGQDSDIIRLELLRKRSQSGSIPRTAGLNMTTAPMVDYPLTKDPSYMILLPLMLYYLMVGQVRIARG